MPLATWHPPERIKYAPFEAPWPRVCDRNNLEEPRIVLCADGNRRLLAS